MENENEKQPKENGLGDPVLPTHEGEVLRDDEQPGQQQESAGFAPLFSMLFDSLAGFVASRKGEHWKASPEEAKNFGIEADRVAALYMDGEKPSPWLGLILVVGVYAAPRAMMDAHKKKQEQAENATEKPN